MKDTAWPGGLDALGCCPACAAPQRSLVHRDLVDNTFYCAPGRWTVWRCADCRSLYLDPRPSRDSIHLAYASYYTHAQAAGTARKAQSLRKALRSWLVDGYCRRGMGDRSPASLLGDAVVRLRPRLRRSLDYGLRGLPPPQPGRKRLLDVGCGNGAFLAVAADHGWDVAGCDFDGVAVARARSLGFDVRHGGPEAFGPGERFDHVTLSHVVEHVHSPVKFLRDMRERMDPSARIFIDTPNADALGLERFGPNWRGLEAPRHLALFTWDGLERVLADAGFGRVVRHPQPQVSRGIWEKSAWIEAGLDPRDSGTDLPIGWNAGLPPDIAIDPWRTEFVTLTAARWA